MIKECVPATILAPYQELLESVRDIILSMQSESESRARVSAMGRPTLVIEEEQLHFYVDNGFKVEDMALTKRT